MPQLLDFVSVSCLALQAWRGYHSQPVRSSGFSSFF